MTVAQVREARAFLGERVVRTPVLRSEVLDAIAGAELWLKCENLQHIGAFKARGALHTVGKLSDEERARGVITFSSGNHAQAVALAARSYGVSAAVAMPEDAPTVKVEAVRALGAQVTFAGTTSDDRKQEAHRIQERTGGVIIQPFDDPNIIAGQGTATLELFEEVHAKTGGSLDVLLVPVGGGGLIAGACLVAAEHETKVLSVEPSTCDAMAQSIEAGQRVRVEPGPTIADGLKPVMVGELNFAIAKQHLSGCLRVEDVEVGRALASLLAYAHVMVEPSGAAALAAALRGGLPVGGPSNPASGAPMRVGVLLSGGNFSVQQLGELLSRYQPYPRP
jgi:threonine dehydratase